MKEYRIKEKNKHFYPQSKNGWKTAWSWEYYRDLGSIIYQGTKFEDGWRNREAYTNWVFSNIQDADDFIKKQKIQDTIKYHKR